MDAQDYVKELSVNGKIYKYYDIQQLSAQGIGNIDRLPFSIKILVENLLRKLDGRVVKEDDLKAIANWQPTYDAPVEIPYPCTGSDAGFHRRPGGGGPGCHAGCG